MPTILILTFYAIVIWRVSKYSKRTMSDLFKIIYSLCIANAMLFHIVVKARSDLLTTQAQYIGYIGLAVGMFVMIAMSTLYFEAKNKGYIVRIK